MYKNKEIYMTKKSKNKKTFSSAEKAKIALEAWKGDLTQAQISSKFGVHSSQIYKWKNHLINNITELFRDPNAPPPDHEKDILIDDLYKKIGQLNIELDWLKKKSDMFRD